MILITIIESDDFVILITTQNILLVYFLSPLSLHALSLLNINNGHYYYYFEDFVKYLINSNTNTQTFRKSKSNKQL